MIIFILSLLAGLIAFFGWFFALGHLLLNWIDPKLCSYSIVFGVSCMVTAALLATITPWIALPFPFLHIIGILFTIIWIFKRPAKIDLSSIPKPNWMFVGTVILLTFYALSVLGYPNYSFDSVSYHIPFANEFAEFGQIPFPETVNNWVDHVHFVFPKAIETMDGLARLFGEYFSGILQVLILLAVVVNVNKLGKEVGIKDFWATGTIFLSMGSLIFIFKAFPLEFSILFFLTTLLYLLWKISKQNYQTYILFILIGMAISMAKINSITYLIPIVLVSAYFLNRWRNGFAVILGGLLGIFATYLPVLFLGINLFSEFELVQALSYISPIPLLDRLNFMLMGLKYLSLQFYSLVGLILTLLLVFIDPKSRKLTISILAAFTAFFVSFLVSNLYFYTYVQFHIYIFAFIALVSIPLTLFLQKIKDTFSINLVKKIIWVLVLVIFLNGVLFGMIQIEKLNDGLHAGIFDFYPKLLEIIPNKKSTVIYSMNNINNITLGFEKTTIYDHTSFSELPQDPCEFWREKGITHVIIWYKDGDAKLYGNSPGFKERAKTAIRENRCSEILFDTDEKNKLLVAKID
jgi:hypothetical protein